MAALPPFPWLPRRDPGAWCRTALGRNVSLQGAVDEVARQLAGCGPADLALVFAAADYASDLPRLLPLLRQKLQASQWLGCCGAGVVGTAAGEDPQEIERQPALSVMLLRLPGVRLHPFVIDTSELPDLDGPAEAWHAAVGVSPSMATSMLLLVDPSSQDLNDLISGLDYAYPQTIKLGGIAGQHSAPHGSLLLDDGVRSGAIGCLIGGAWRLDPVLAQGCRPIGPVMEVEQAQRNVVLQVSTEGERQRSPVEALQAILTHLSPAEREQVRHSLFLGVGRNDFRLSPTLVEPSTFLVRNLLGVDPRNGAVAVGERMRVGQKVQFQLRDAAASREEARQLLARQANLQPAPLAALLFACLGRGEGLYGEADGDVRLCREAFSQLPIAGLFCNGEIGPLGAGDSTHLHGYTASWAFLVPNPPEALPDLAEPLAVPLDD